MIFRAVFVLGITILCQLAQGADNEPHLALMCDSFAGITERVPTMVKEVCTDLTVTLVGVDAPFRVKILLDDVEFAVKDVTANDLTTNTLTDIVGEIFVTVDTTQCDNRVQRADVIIVTNINGVDTEYKTMKPKMVTILCNFMDYDLSVTSGTFSPIIVDIAAGETLNSKIAADIATDFTLMLDSTVQTVSTELPQLAGDTCYFVVAYLTNHPVPSNTDCTSGTGPSPNIMYTDMLVGTPKCFRNLAELQNINNVKELVDGTAGEIKYCAHGSGVYTLVIMVDPLVTVVDEADRCNNYVTIPVDVVCPSENEHQPRCEIITNPFRMGATTFLYSGMMTDNTMDPPVTTRENKFYETRDHGFEEKTYMHYDGTTDEVDRYASTLGYGRIKIINAYIKSQITANDCSDDETTLMDELKDLDETKPLDTQEVDSGRDTVLVVFELAKEKIELLKADTPNYDAIIAAIQSEIDGLPMPQVTLDDSIPSPMYNISLGALKAVKQMAMALKNNDDMMMAKTSAVKDGCDAAEHLHMYIENVKWLRGSSSDTEMKKWIKPMLVDFIGNLSARVINMTYFYPKNKCPENMFLKIVSQYVKMMNNPIASEEERMNEFDFVFKTKPVESEDGDDKCRYGSPNKCLVKMMQACKGDVACQDSTAITDSSIKEMICVAKKTKEVMNTAYRTYGAHDIYKKLGDKQHEECDGSHPMKPALQMLNFWKKDTSGHIKIGVPDLENMKICWKSKAVCTCDTCDDRPGTEPKTDDGTTQRRRK